MNMLTRLALGLVMSACVAGTPAWAEDPGTVTVPMAAQVMEHTDKLVVLNDTIYSMGTRILVRVAAPNMPEAQAYLARAQRDVAFYNDLLSVHKPTPLNDVNRHAGRAVEVPQEVALLVMRAKTAAKDSQGAFDPTIGAVVNVWKIGFGGDHKPSEKAIQEAVRHVGWKNIDVFEELGKWYVRIPPGFFLDLGGIAKGYIGDAMVDHLRTMGMQSGIVDLGGNVALVGAKPDGSPWRVGLQFPGERRGEYFGVVSAVNTNVITSGAYERFIKVDGKTYGHILSPITGQPVKTDVASVTVISPDGTLADAWCTALFAMGWQKAKAFLQAHPDWKVVLMNADLKTVAVTKAAQDQVHITDPAVTIQWID